MALETARFAMRPGVKPHESNMPQHIAIVMDGNGRWARQRRLSRTAGHRKGLSVAREIIEACQSLKIPVLTLFAFGMENQRRPSKEVRNLLRLFFLSLRRDMLQLHEHQICLRVIGDRRFFPSTLIQAIQETETLTRHNKGLQLHVAVNYSGRWDLVRAMQHLAEEVQAHRLTIDRISEEKVSRALSLQGLIEPDLFIRTGGVQRLSNFLLWDLAYTELHFTPILWPDFNKDALQAAIQDYATRERRFGLTGEQLGI